MLTAANFRHFNSTVVSAIEVSSEVRHSLRSGKKCLALLFSIQIPFKQIPVFVSKC